MRGLVLSIVVASLLVGCAAAEPKLPALETDEQKTMYALGVALAGSLRGAEYTDEEIPLIQAGLADGIRGGDLRVDMDVFKPKVNTLVMTRVSALSAQEKIDSDAYCDKIAEETEGARRTASGAIYIETAPGEGASPGETDSVRVHYHGTLRDGSVFDSSVDRGQPAVFRVDRVVPCFGEGLREMKVGGKAKLVCPPDTAYGERGSPPRIRPNVALNFEVELLEIVEAE